MRYSVRQRRWFGAPERPAKPDPYGTTSAGYAERHEEHTWAEPSGIIRTDMGNKPTRP